MSLNLNPVNVADVKSTSRGKFNFKAAFAKRGAVRITSSEKGNIVTLTLYGNHKFAAFQTAAAEITKEYRESVTDTVNKMIAGANDEQIATWTKNLHESQKALRAKYQKKA